LIEQQLLALYAAVAPQNTKNKERKGSIYEIMKVTT
jgi:hypothetical protein